MGDRIVVDREDLQALVTYCAPNGPKGSRLRAALGQEPVGATLTVAQAEAIAAYVDAGATADKQTHQGYWAALRSIVLQCSAPKPPLPTDALMALGAPASPMFNEHTLRAEIVAKWGEYGAHADVFDALLRAASRPEEPSDGC